jgi:adenylate cyclase
MPKINFLPDNVEVESEGGETILDVALRVGIPHTHACGGSGRCSTCRVLILDGSTGCDIRNNTEQDLANQLNFKSQIRLACQTFVSCDLRVRRLVLDADDELLTDQRNSGSLSGPIGDEKQMAILFADIAGFTQFSESLLPYDVIYSLNRYFFEMDKVISKHGGRIANYMGDGLMALFINADSAVTSLNAVKAGLAMFEELAEINEYFRSLYDQGLKIRIGAHFGTAIIGVVGAPDKDQLPTAIGDSVNFASRLERANKQLGTQFLISNELYSLIDEQIQVNKHADIQIRGKFGLYSLYEPVRLLA